MGLHALTLAVRSNVLLYIGRSNSSIEISLKVFHVTSNYKQPIREPPVKQLDVAQGHQM